MGAFKCYNEKIVKENDNLFYMFECKKCGERWFHSFCLCPKCKTVSKFRIMSGEQAVNAIKDKQEQEFLQMAVYGLLNGEK